MKQMVFPKLRCKCYNRILGKKFVCKYLQHYKFLRIK